MHAVASRAARLCAEHLRSRDVAEIYGVCSGERHAAPDVVAELVQVHGAWLLANVCSSDGGGDLLSALRLLREAREQHP